MHRREDENQLVIIKDLHKHFSILGGIFLREKSRLKVINGIDMAIRKREILGLAGESGCGKSTLARLMMLIERPSGGRILFQGRDLCNLSGRTRRDYYRRVQMIFQDPYASLNPRLKVRDLIGEMPRIGGASKAAAYRKTLSILEDVGLDATAMDQFPFEFSGGQRQRIAIARAVINRPKLLIADEPASALDLTIQKRIIDLLASFHNRLDLTMLFISHDLDLLSDFCDRVAVMYLGRIVEVIAAKDLLDKARHPYVQALIESMPVSDPRLRTSSRIVIRGEVPNPAALPSGCSFHPRCSNRFAPCAKLVPELTQIGPKGHMVACHLFI
jgi:oligopeptide/dipeptide ABC transporter ATP-binding protein